MPKLKMKRQGLLISAYTGKRSKVGDIVSVDPQRAILWTRKGWAEYAGKDAATKPETRIAPDIEVDGGDLSGSDDPDEMTTRELRDALRTRGETIPHNARKSELIALYKGEDESC